MKKRAIRYALLLFTAGVAITVFNGYVQRNTISTYEETLPYVTFGENVRNRVNQSQLAFEKGRASSAAVNYTDITSNLASAVALLQSAYDGKATEEFEFRKLTDEEFRVALKHTILETEKLISLTKEKSASLTPIVVNDSVTTMPPAFDDSRLGAQFDEVKASVDNIIKIASGNLKSKQSTVAFSSWLSIAVVTLSFSAAAWFLYRQKQHSDRNMEENRERLKKQEESTLTISSFIESVSAGNFSVDLQLEGENGLNHTLLKMRDKLKENGENDKRRNWTTSGLAQIGEILRSNNTSLTDLYDSIIKFVVKYTRSNQGGLFLLNEESDVDKHLELVACYAFERKKYLTKKVEIGEGLIGQCYLEGERIYVRQLPGEYVAITSGLGGSAPNALLIVPLRVNDKIYGVLELASFGKYDDFEIELVEKLAETIGSTISAVRINESTRILLEKTQQQAEEMRAQEEEMRQNMEELEATQEEMRRKERHIEVMLEAEKKRNAFNNKGRQLVIELSKSNVLLEGNWERSLEKITAAVGEHLKVSRVAIYGYDEMMNNMYTAKSFRLETRGFAAGPVFRAKECPAFVQAVLAEKIIIAKDALSNPDTAELADTYLKPEGISSMLILPFLSEGKLAGLIACENYEQMDWTDDYIEFLKSCADLLTVTRNTVRINAMVTNLSEAQETLQTIIDNLPRAVFWKDRDLRIQGCNRIFASVAGLKSHLDLIGKTDFDMPWKDHAEAYRADDIHVMTNKIARIDQEEKNVNSEGKESWVLTSKVPVLNKEGEVVAVLGMFEDITERKRREADVNVKLMELEQLKNMLQKQKN